MNKNFVLAAAAAVTVAQMATSAMADDTWNGNASDGLWKSALNWANLTIPGANAGETADFFVNTGGDLTVSIDANVGPALNPLLNLKLGSQDDAFVTTINGLNGATLTASNIISSGSTDGGSNVIDLSFVLPATGNVVLSKDATHASGYALTFNQGITNSALVSRTIQNTIPNADMSAPSAAVTYNTGVVLSTASGSGLTTTFRTDTNAYTIFNGAISGQSGMNVLFAGGGVTELNADNNYAGSTILGANSPNVSGTIKIGSSTPFSTGQVTFTGGASTQFLEAVGSPRTIANTIVLGRYGGVQGSVSQTWSGTVSASNSRGIVNNMTGAATLTLSGNIFTDNTTGGTGRVFDVQGAGTTIITGVLDDHQTLGDVVGQLKNSGTGTVRVSSDSTYHGDTFISSAGKVIVGNGATAGSLVNSKVVTGGTAGTGTFAFDRSDDLISNQVLNGAVGFSKLNNNTVTLSDTNFNTGSNTISAGKLVVNGGSVSQSAQDGLVTSVTSGTVNTIRTISGLADTSGLKVGQSVWLTSAGAYAGSYIKSIDSATQITVYTVGTAVTPNVLPQNITFGAGYGLGGNTTVQGGATLAGSGSLGGNITIFNNATLAPGNSIESLDVAGNVQFNPGSHWEIEYDGAGAGSIDLLAVAGGITVFGGNLDFSNVGDLPDDSVYVFATFGGPITLTGSFTENNVPSGYLVNYAYNGNSFALVTIPEPATLGLLGLGSLIGLRRRRC